MAISEEHKAYGDILARFASAETTDEAGLKFSEDAQKLFSLDQFKEESLDNFPQISITTLNEREAKLARLIILEEALFSELDGCLGNDDDEDVKDEIRFNHQYDFDKNTLTFEPEIIIKQSKTFDVHVDELKEKNLFTNYIKKHPALMDKLYSDITRLMELGKVIEKVKKSLSVSKERCSEIREIADYYYILFHIHKHIHTRRDWLRTSLHQMVNGVSLEENRELQYFLRIYNKLKREPLVFHVDELIKKSLFSEVDFAPVFDFDKMHKNRIIPDSGGLHIRFFIRPEAIDLFNKVLCSIYDEPIVYCVIEFAKKPENIKHLKKCPYCSNFFIADDIRRGRCYSPACQTKFNTAKTTKYRKKQR